MPLDVLDVQAVLQSAATALGDGNAIALRGHNAISLQITGTFVATITFEATQDGTNFVAIPAINLNSLAQSTTTTTTGIYLIYAAGMSYVRARISVYTSGSVTVKGRALSGANGTPQNTTATISSALPAGNNNIGDVDVASSTLPTGAATSAKQDTGNTSLALMIPAANCVSVTPNDGADLANNTRGLMVSVAGDVKVDFVTTGSAIVLTGLLAGVVYPLQIKRVYSTSTTATGILALY
jgi:hypothetical protein